MRSADVRRRIGSAVHVLRLLTSVATALMKYPVAEA